ncbi:Holliday junction DNA helicase RuvA [Paucilactobacillus vaccinostercus DSM 20634]|uniref:Holliday junction branch migration complex subunit RuvA n=1 Tax=Paucilactobacillus vaccinostercus DSM 20634 TaxID=1423813 RepID=A0A0R2A554_9LACO|nr:Holliday junction branch migration protein RuvA [Paucilactobacillus vaccinostercus]KRM60612.1 Holliday junction DNA helicase RuvA [Paucilactobacillus vaccinostercus DSM 20634]
MFEYFEGFVTIVTPAFVVLDVHGVGYKLMTANPYRYQEDDQKKVRIFVYQAVRDNDMALYGFYDQEEKALFEKLINVSGIGPKSALAILANTDHSGLVDAIAGDDVAYLTKFPGIGKKTAGQIILDLKDKIGQLSQPDLFHETNATQTTDQPALQDALAALEALGYRSKEVEKIAKKLRELPTTTTDEYLRHGLTLLTK